MSSRHPSRAEPALQGARDVGTDWAGVAMGECAPTSKRQVLQGDRAVSPSVRKRDMGLSLAAMARLEGFHIHAAYWMAKEHVPWRGPNLQWVYPSSQMVLEECGMHTIQHYIDVQRETIAKYVVGCSILAECQGADHRRGLVPRRWWWEQRMCLDDI